MQQNGNTLSGGTWRVSGNGVLNLDEAGAVNFTTNQGDVTLDGALASFARINTLTNNQGAFRLLGARNFSAVGAFSNSGILQLGGGTFDAPSLANAASGEIFGFGTVTPRVVNSGMVRASGGTLTASNGIDGQSGTLQSDAGATLALGADSDGDFLVNNGSLSLGTSNVTVAEDYTNANFGEGNAFDARANVSGSGQILASGDVAQALSGQLVDGGTANPGMNFGNIHVGDSVTRQYSIANTGASGPALRGAIQTSVNGGNLDDARLSGSGVTASNFGPVAAGASSAALDVTLTGSSAGALSGQSVAVVNNFDNVAEQVLSISGAVFRYANPTAHTPEPINFGNRRVGDVTNQALTISNDVANDGFSERLDASIGGVTGQATSNDGSFALLAAGASDNASLAVGIDTATAGHKAGTATITLTSNGAGTSGLGTTALGTQTVNVSGDVFRLASASAHTPEPVVFANRHVGDGASQALSLTNTAANDGFSERLNASIGGATGNATSNNGSFALLSAGATDSSALTVGIDTSSAGHKSGTATISLASDGAGTSGFAALALGTQTVNVSGDVYRLASASAHTPEPINFGNRRVGDVTNQALTISNDVANDGFSERLDASIGGVTGQATSNDGSFTLLAAGASDNASLAVGIDTATAGHKAGTATITLTSNGAGTSDLGTTALGTQTVNVSGDVFRLASASAHTPEPVVFANRHVGDDASQALSLTNTAANDGFSERLNASIGGATGNATSNNGSFALLSAGATDSSALTVGIDTSSAGHKSGTATISLASDGAGTSGFAALALGTQTVNVSGDVYRLASASAHTPEPINFGNRRVGDVTNQALTLSNDVANDGFSERLDASIGGVTGQATSNDGSFALLAAGASDNASLAVGIDTATAGHKAGTATITLTSNGAGTSDLGTTALGTQTVNVSGDVFRLASASAHRQSRWYSRTVMSAMTPARRRASPTPPPTTASPNA
ncbi:MAG: choice-of-anchor D domain-containing protein [Proteobacteria bacterium]|nr:choice-of-anchor D domain-containing protein [Pseudomonadota bacterium]